MGLAIAIFLYPFTTSSPVDEARVRKLASEPSLS
jgi:hypothetical protein